MRKLPEVLPASNLFAYNPRQHSSSPSQPEHYQTDYPTVDLALVLDLGTDLPAGSPWYNKISDLKRDK